MISVQNNIILINNQMKELVLKKKQIQRELLKLEGSLKVFTDLQKLDVEEIPVNKNEVIDHQDIPSE